MRGRVRRARVRLTAAALDRAHERRLFTADECAGAHAHFQVEGEAAAEHGLAQQAVGAGLLNGMVQARHRQRVLSAAIYVSLVSADSIGGDEHALDNGVRIAFEHLPIHKRAGVALVGVADNVLKIAGVVAAELPLLGGGKAGPTPPTQTRGAHRVDHLLRRQRHQRLGQRLVTVHGQVVGDVFGINLAAMAQNYAQFFGPRRAQLAAGGGCGGPVGARCPGGLRRPPAGH
jgi:hypothetical protein